jgi:ketosteroid isomerase-like protein
MPVDESFQKFLKHREVVSGEYISGRPEGLLSISPAEGEATFFPPNGTTIRGAKSVNEANAKGAKSFSSGSEGHFEIFQSDSDGEIAFWTGLQHADAKLAGQDKPVHMKLRVTEVFRQVNGRWLLIHRHANEAAE